MGVETLQQAYDVLDALLVPLGVSPAGGAEADDPVPASRRRRAVARNAVKGRLGARA